MSRRKKFLRFLIAAILLASFATLYSIYRHASRYPYDVTKDYLYDFSDKDTVTRTVSVENNRIVPDFTVPGRNSSLLLKLRIESSLPGKYLQPVLTVTSGKNSIAEYLEPGAKGIRYINISPLQIKHGDTLTLQGKYLNVPDQKAELIVSKNPNLKEAKILILAPHPDDAEIAAYGLYSTFHENTYIVTATAGDYGPNLYDEIYSDPVKAYMAKAKIRIWNSITVPLIGSIPPKRCVNLGFFDGTLEKMYQQKPHPVTALGTKISDVNIYRHYNISPLAKKSAEKATWATMVKDFGDLLQKIQPDIVLAPSPVLDNHPDHRYAAIALFEAIAKNRNLHGKVLLYTNHFTLNEYYPYGEAGGAVSPPPNFQELYFESIYSFNLPKEKQQEKILALDAMNDLRLDTEWHTARGAFKVALKELLKRDYLGIEYANYYRRAVRRNELFFVVDFKAFRDKEKFRHISGLRE